MAETVRNKVSKYLFAGVSFLLVLSGFLYTNHEIKEQEQSLEAKAIQQAGLVADAVHINYLYRLKENGQTSRTPAYWRLKQLLDCTKNAIPHCLQVSIVGKTTDGDITTLVSSGKTEEPDTRKESIKETINAVFSEGKAAATSSSSDNKTPILRACTPITSPGSSQVIAAVCITFDTENPCHMAPSGITPIVLFMALFLIVLVIGTILLIKRGKQHVTEESWPVRYAHVVIVIGIGLSLTGYSAYIAHVNETRRRTEAFDEFVTTKAKAVARALRNICETDLEGLANFFEASEFVSREEFREYTRNLAQKHEVLAWGWMPRIPQNQKAEFESRMRNAGFAEFKIWQSGKDDAQIPVEPRDVYYPATYLVPQANSIRAIGFDIASEPRRLAALKTAIATKLGAATEPVKLVSENSGPSGILACRPIFKSHEAKLLRGFVVVAIKLDDLLASFTRSRRNQRAFADFGLYQLHPDAKPRLLSTTLSLRESAADSFQPQPADGIIGSVMIPFSVYGQTLAITARPGPGFIDLYPVNAYWLAIAIGLVLTIALAAFTASLSRRSIALQALVDVRTAELRERNEELKSKEEDLRITLHSIGDAVITTDTSGKITRMNPVAEQLTGWALQEAQNATLAEVFRIINGETRESSPNPVDKVLTSGEVVDLDNDTVLIAKNGTEYRVADSGAPIRSTSGEIVGVVLVFRDVTKEYALEEQLRQSQKMEAIGQLAGGVAHDFNNMLGGIMGAAELLNLKMPDDPELKKFINMIDQSSENAAKLTRQLLAFARKQQTASTVIDVHQILNDTVTLLKSTIDRRINISLELSAEAAGVVGDPAQLQSAFLNLCINSAQAMPNGGSIYVSSQTTELDQAYCDASAFPLEPGQYLEIEVRDTGEGIPPEIVTRIFEPFFTTKKKGEGTGLGLAAVFGTVQQHLGAIMVYSEVGSGTSFHVVLPLAEGEATSIAAKTNERIKGTGRILVIDDEPVMRATAGAILESLGYNVMLAEGGKSGLELYQDNMDSIDLIILDMIMPDMNGKDCFAKLQEINPDVKVILSSGFSREEDFQQMKHNGLTGFIHKPFHGAGLSQIVHDAMKPQQNQTGVY